MKKIGIIIVGLVIIAVGIFLIINGKNLEKRCTESAEGTVVEIVVDSQTDSDGTPSTTYYPIIEYKVGEQIVSKQSSTGSGSSDYKIGEKVEILYNPNKAEEYIIKGDKSSNVLGIVFIVVGIFMTCVGIFKKI